MILADFSGPAPAGSYPSCAGDPRGGCSTAGQVSWEWSRAPLPHLAAHGALGAAQDAIGFLGCKGTLQNHAELLIHQRPQVLLLGVVLNPVSAQPALVLGSKRTVCLSIAFAKCLLPSCGHCGMDKPLWNVTWEINLFWEGNSLAHFVVFVFLLILYFIASKRALATHTPLLCLQHVPGFINHPMFPAIQQTERKGEGNKVRRNALYC